MISETALDTSSHASVVASPTQTIFTVYGSSAKVATEPSDIDETAIIPAITNDIFFFIFIPPYILIELLKFFNVSSLYRKSVSIAISFV